MAGDVRDDLVLVGFVGKPHGVYGDVKVVPETDDPHRFEDFKHVHLEIDGRAQRFSVTRVRMQSSKRGLIPVLSLDGVGDREHADALRRIGIYVEEDELELEEDEFFLHDLIGLQTEDESGTVIGTVQDVMSLPAGPVLVVSRPNEKDALIPAVPEFVAEITESTIVIKVIEGLFDL